MQQPQHKGDPLTSVRYVVGWGMVTLLFWLFIGFLLVGCATPTHTPTGAVVKAAAVNVDTATRLSTDARSAVLEAKQELESPEPNVEAVQLKLSQADKLLQKQHTELQLAHTSLQEAERMSALTSKEIDRLKKQSEKYRLRYESMKKYRWAIAAICGWLLIKLLGNLGAWSPQGRVARFFVG